MDVESHSVRFVSEDGESDSGRTTCGKEKQPGWISRRRRRFEEPLARARHDRYILKTRFDRLRDRLNETETVERLVDAYDAVARCGRDYLRAVKKTDCLRARLDRLDGLAPGLERENRDVDGACRFQTRDDEPCKGPTVEGTRFCGKHVDEWCVECARHATHYCEGRVDDGVCGMPLCERCRHEH